MSDHKRLFELKQDDWVSACKEIDQLRAELETERIRLAACGVAAMANTEECKADRINKENPYWSASYGDVCATVDREVSLRVELTAAKEREEKYKSEIADLRGEYKVFQSTALREHEENKRLKRIIAKELTENDELGSEFVYVGVLKERIQKLEGALDEAMQSIKDFWRAHYWSIGKEYLAAEAIENNEELNSYAAILAGQPIAREALKP